LAVSKGQRVRRPWDKSPDVTKEPAMSHSLIGADRRTLGKIVAVALGAALSVVTVGSTAWQAETKSSVAHMRTGIVVKAGKPAISASADVTALR
jgi:hypothetical protein